MRRPLPLSLPHLLVSALFVCAVALVSSHPGHADTASFTGLGKRPGCCSSPFRAEGISGDGSTVVGSVLWAGGERAARWTATGGVEDVGLLPLPGHQFSRATAASADGSTITGLSSGWVALAEAFAWTEAGGMTGVRDDFVALQWSQGVDVSADGSRIVVTGQLNLAAGEVAVRWTPGVSAVVVAGDHSQAAAVSGDGLLTVGRSTLVPSSAFSHTDGGGLVDLLPSPPAALWPHGLSADGSTVVGYLSGVVEGFRLKGGSLMYLSDLPGGSFDSRARDTSADGRWTVGIASTCGGYAPFIHDADVPGMENLAEELKTKYRLGKEMEGWVLVEVVAISDDGKTVVGNGHNPDGEFEAWIAVLGEPVTWPLWTTLDFENGRTPDFHDWVPYAVVPPASQSNTVECLPAPSGGAHNLTMTATNRGGWYLDLTDHVPLDRDWVFEIHVRRDASSDPGINDFAIHRIGAGNSAHVALPFGADGSYHRLRMEMSQETGLVRKIIDDEVVGDFAATSDLNPFVPSTNAIAFEFGNDTITATFHIDRVTFEVLPWNVPTLPPIAAPGLALLFLGAGAARIARRSRRARPGDDAAPS